MIHKKCWELIYRNHFFSTFFLDPNRKTNPKSNLRRTQSVSDKTETCRHNKKRSGNSEKRSTPGLRQQNS